MERWQGRVALVTGASSGIGAGIVEALVKHGMKVIGCARSVDKIQAHAQQLSGAKGTLYPEKCDLSNENEILELFKRIKAKHGGVDVCVNNAGLALDAPLLTGDYKNWNTMLQVNIMALSICTQEAYKSMKERNVTDGHIIHINSYGGHVMTKMPGISFYSSTKQFVRVLLHGLRNEIRATNTDIRVSEISPGVVETGAFEVLGGKDFAKQMLTQLPSLRPSDIASTLVHMLGAPIGVESLRPSDIASTLVHMLGAPIGVEINEAIVLPTRYVHEL